jgi:hypothetical protein
MNEQELKDTIAQALASEDIDVINNIYEAIEPFTNQLRDMADAPTDGTSIDLYVKINGCNPFRLVDCNNEGKGWVFDSGLSILHHYKGKKIELLGWTPILQVTK